MSKNINLSEKIAVSIRKATAFFSLFISAMMLILIILGFIPNFDQSANAWKMFGNLMELFSIGTKPLMFCLLRFGFAICYFFMLFWGIRDLISIIRNIKCRINDDHDTNASRSMLSNCVMLYNKIFVRFVVLVVLSHILDSYNLSLWSGLVLSVLVLFNFAINYIKMLLLKRDLIESAFSPLGTVLILTIVILFMFNYNSVDFDIYIKQIINFIRSSFDIPFRRVVQGLFEFVLIPSFFLYALVRLVLIFREFISYGVKSWRFEQICKRFAVINLIAFAVIVISQIISSESYSLRMLWKLCINNAELILFGVAVYFLSKNQGTKCPDIPSYDDIIKAEMEAQERENEAAKEAETIETIEITEIIE